MEFSIEYLSAKHHIIRSIPSNEVWEVLVSDGDLSVIKNNTLHAYIVTGAQISGQCFWIRPGDGSTYKEYPGWKSGLFLHDYMVVADDVVFLMKQRWNALHLYKNDVKAGVVSSNGIHTKVSLVDGELEGTFDVEMMLSLILYFYWEFYIVP